ncbi:hypothetical protein [Ramlibacter sp.]|uniref:hypothetical protein n=1 Tax=Ramlibacter sp. TaxID=1917967 RepID=UPI002638D298|nr:hypothetical protein [Ramlibacter sp.]MDB5958224.1 hypothetical protein [Ramlibacter sp.]
MNRFHFTQTVARALVLVGGAVAMVSALAADPMGHIRGTIVSATANKLTVRTAEGSVSVAIDATTRIAGIVPSGLEQIKSGTFVGIANVPGAGTSRALEVVVFPEAMKGTGIGDYPWDLSPKSAAGGGKTSAMTNGTVTAASAGGSAMTNGTVKATSKANGLVLTVDYGKGEKKIEVPASVPVVGIVPGDASKLVPGAHVFVATKKDAPQTAGFVAVGIDGAVPPM